MERSIDRRSFLRVAGAAVGIGALYQFAPLLTGRAAADPIADFYRRANGEAPGGFTFAQFSDPHVGFEGPSDPLGTRAFESSVQLLNQSSTQPDFVLFTGDLTHDTEVHEQHAQRMRRFKEISGKLKCRRIHAVPGENDAALDGGMLYREHFGETHYSFDHKGVHFVGLDNVSRGRSEIGAEQRAWLRQDLARFSKTTPVIIFTHRPLFDLKPEWEWFTSDGAEVMNELAGFESVAVLYGHIHRHHVQTIGGVSHYAARSLIFGFNDPTTNADKKQLPFDKTDPFKDLGIRLVDAASASSRPALQVADVVLTKSEFAGLAGMQSLLKRSDAPVVNSSTEMD